MLPADKNERPSTKKWDNARITKHGRTPIIGSQFWPSQYIFFLSSFATFPFQYQEYKGDFALPRVLYFCIYFACQFRKDCKLSKTGNSSGSSPWNKNTMPIETPEVTSSSSSRRIENSTENILKSLDNFGGKCKSSYNSTARWWAAWELFSELLKTCSFA